MNDKTLEAVRKDYQVFTTIEQQLRDGNSVLKIEFVDTVLQVIQQHKEYLYKKYPL